ncbi:MAG: FGGY-family carbohydrate kinase, partial [Christensenellaceae bacterium]
KEEKDKMLFCGIDVGTSGVKAVIFDEKGEMAATAFLAYVLDLKSDGTRELNACDIWEKTKQVVGMAVAQSKGDICAIAVSSFGEAFVMLDKDDHELNDVMIYTDRRGEKEYFEAMQKSSDLEIARICGLPPSTTYSISKILYLKHNFLQLYEKADKILLIEDYINYKLCGYAVTDGSVACRTMLFDVHKREWSEILMNKFGIDKNKFSKPMMTGEKVGPILPNIAKELGLLQDVQIVVGGHDQPMSAMGAGVRKNTTVCSMGTSECMTPVFDRAIDPNITLKTSLSSEPAWEKGKFSTLAYNPTSGLLIKWFFDVFAADFKETPYALFEKNMPQNPTKIFVQPYLMGSGPPYMDFRARFGLVGADIGTSRYELYKAVLEGLALDQRLSYEILRDQGVQIDTIICVGGGSKSLPWLQAKADVMQVCVSTLKCKEAGALGCAIACAVAMGAYESFEQAGEQMSAIASTIEPNVQNKKFYDEKFSVYKNLHSDLKTVCDFVSSWA